MTVEQKLKKLFDFQKFEPNARLAKMAEEAEAGVVRLSDEELFFVNAAGDPGTVQRDEGGGGASGGGNGTSPQERPVL